MATDAKTVLQEIRAVIAALSGFSKKTVNSNRKTGEPRSGTYSASVLYAGEDNEFFVINGSNSRYDINMPVAIEVRTSSSQDDDLVDKLYAVRDAVLLPANKPTDVIIISPVSIDEPEGTEYLTATINILVQFRRG